MADGIFTTDAARPRKANEYFANLKQFKPQAKLFDEFWREGEIALFFGPSRTGKSILAMQVAESIARGHAIDGFELGAWRQKVLYVDLKLSERQFIARYANEGKPYKLSGNLYREKPNANEKLINWLRKNVSENGFRVIVIDDLSAVRMSYDGTRETLKLMRDLRDLRDEFDLSILVVAGSQEQKRGEFISEAHMMRSRVLCDVADSVFAIGVHAGNPQYRYLIQTRTQVSAIKWHGNDVPICSIQRSDEGFPSMAFDERFVADLDEETRQMICNVKWARDAGASIRSIADYLSISKSKVTRLLKKWTPALEKNTVEESKTRDAETQGRGDAESEPPASAGGLTQASESLNEYEDLRAELSDAEDLNDNEPQPPATAGGSDLLPGGSDLPFLAALRRVHVSRLKHGVDNYGRDIFILEEQNDGKPNIWFEYDSKGKMLRKDRNSLGVKITHIESPWLTSADLRHKGMFNLAVDISRL